MVCESELTISILDVQSMRLEPVARLSARDGVLPAVNRLIWVDDTLFVAGDGYVCTGIGRVAGDRVEAIPPLSVEGALLDIGATYQRTRGDCRDLPRGGFVTEVGDAMVLLASPGSAGVSPNDRRDVPWSIYQTDADWKVITTLANGVLRPLAVAPVDACAVLLVAEMPSAGVWWVPVDGRPFEPVLEGVYSDVSVEPLTGSVALLAQGGEAQSLRLARMDDRLRICPPSTDQESVITVARGLQGSTVMPSS
jgi:hypothetical protein